MKPARVIRLRLPRLARSSWAQLSAFVEKRLAERVIPHRLFLARADWEALRASEAARDAEAARHFFRAKVGPYVAPLLPRGAALYESE